MKARIMLLKSRFEGVLLLCASSFIFIVYSTMCVTDLNHPPGVRWIRLASVLVCSLMALVEYKRAFCGLTIFAALFSQFLPIKVLYVSRFSAHASALPDITSWACAAALSVAIVARQFRTVPPDPVPVYRAKIDFFYRLIPIALIALIVVAGLSAIFSFSRLRAAPEHWGILNAYYRGLLSIHPLSELMPIRNALPIVANGLLALAIIRAVLFEEGVSGRIKWVLLAFVASMLIAAGQFVWQMGSNWTWPFHYGGPSGPFENRNLAVPMMIMGAASLAWVIKETPSFMPRCVYAMVALGLCVVAMRMGSRAGLVILLGLAWAFALAGAGRVRTVLVAIFLPALVLAALYWAPLPDPSKISNETARRSAETINSIRVGEWTAASTYRNHLWYGAAKIWMKYPVLGSGPGTYYLYTNHVPETKLDVVKTYGVASYSAHSSPINLLAECGPLACLSWVYIFLIAPLYVVITSRRHAVLSIALLAFGIVNLIDTAWYSDGAMTMVAVWIASAIYEQRNDFAAL